ncbi:kinase-like domain-containing protein [Fennellomyces sp. T-0311]|nr:kinase-like domain-containing protein [Fennellomyces sp. T-0311]
MNRRLQQRLTEPEVLKIFSDVCEALAYMHYCNPPVLHRDLKVENILILSQDHYKLCDFGSAALSKGSYVPTNLQEIQKIEDDIQRHTTLQYRAPEMIDIYQRKPINEKGDIWAMGVLLYKLCYYTTPFEEQGQLAILNARYSIPTHPHFSEGLRRLIVSMLQENQNQRPNIYQVLKAVCQLRGVECPIRNIYSEQPPQAQPAPKARSQHESPTAIFERLPTPPQQMPEIVPMRRGRPVRHAKTDSLTEKTFDPFDPAHISNTTTAATPSSSDLDDAFALNEQNLRAVAEDEKKVRNSMTFESDFQPTRPRSEVIASSSSASSPESRPLSNQSSGKPFSSKLADFSSNQFSGGGLASLHKASTTESNGISPQPSSQRLRPSPQSNQLSGGTPESKTQITPEETPTLRNNVSSDIEARLNALKMSVEGSSPASDLSAPPKPSRSTKPTPPPKPARFRIAQNKPESSSAPPLKPTRSTTMDVADFESKFPSIEELYKNFPVSASGSNNSN